MHKLLGQDKAMVQPIPDSYPRKITHSSFKCPHRWHARHSRAALSLQHSIKLKIKDSDRKLSFLSGKGMPQEGQLLLASLHPQCSCQYPARSYLPRVHFGRGWLFDSKNHRPKEILRNEIKRNKISMWDNTPVKVIRSVVSWNIGKSIYYWTM